MIEPRGKLALAEAIGGRPAELHRNARRPVLVVDEAQLAGPPDAIVVLAQRSSGVPGRMNTRATQSLFMGATRAVHQIDAARARDVADDKE